MKRLLRAIITMGLLSGSAQAMPGQIYCYDTDLNEPAYSAELLTMGSRLIGGKFGHHGSLVNFGISDIQRGDREDFVEADSLGAQIPHSHDSMYILNSFAVNPAVLNCSSQKRAQTSSPQICTFDINEWGNSSNCACDSDSYDPRVGLCVDEGEQIKVFESGRIFSIDGQKGESVQLGFVTDRQDYTYELIVPTVDRQKLERMTSIVGSAPFEVTGYVVYSNGLPLLVSSELYWLD